MTPQEYRQITSQLNTDVKILKKKINNLKSTIQTLPKYERFTVNQNLLILESMLIDTKLQYNYYKSLS